VDPREPGKPITLEGSADTDLIDLSSDQK
jgi:hypothetical protein